MRTIARTPAAALCLLGSTLGASAAHADDNNFRPYIVGARAAGMGGAYTALADDGAGPYYNPGGVAFARRSSLSLSASVYGLVSGTFADALGPGHDFSYQDLNAFPVSTSVVSKFGDHDTPDGSAANAFVVSVFVPDAFRADDRDQIGSQQNAFFLGQQVQTVWGGLTYARRIGRIGIGASAFLLINTANSNLDLTAVSPNDGSQFATITAREDLWTVAVVGAAGVRVDATDHLRLGLSVFSPAAGGGKRRFFVRAATGFTPAGGMPQSAVVNADDLSATPTLPLRAQGGIAWTDGNFTVAADGVFLASRETLDDADRAGQGLDRHVVRNAVGNGSVGLEYVAGGFMPLRAGFFTDFAASNEPQPAPPGMPNPNASNTEHVDRYGLSASIGYKTEHTSTDIGAIFSFGSGKEAVPNNLDFSDLVPTTDTQRYVYIFLASAYEF